MRGDAVRFSQCGIRTAWKYGSIAEAVTSVMRSGSTDSHRYFGVGMRERVTALGGQLDVFDLGDRGFRLHAMIPFEVTARIAQ
jgi:hypothetical protein